QIFGTCFHLGTLVRLGDIRRFQTEAHAAHVAPPAGHQVASLLHRRRAVCRVGGERREVEVDPGEALRHARTHRGDAALAANLPYDAEGPRLLEQGHECAASYANDLRVNSLRQGLDILRAEHPQQLFDHRS
ncbi:MAG: hypothetical protein ACK56I_09045, partial [bacterium]